MLDPTRIERIDIRPLNCALLAPFGIASAQLESVRNVAVRIELADGSEGFGEVPTLPPVTPEDQPIALRLLEAEREHLVGGSAAAWRRIAAELAERLPAYPTVRAGLEMALLDAFAKHAGVPLFQFFGGAGNRLQTDVTIPICRAEAASQAARTYRDEGFTTLKIKIGQDLAEDFVRIRAVREAHPDCRLILDANAGYSAGETLELLAALRRVAIEPDLLEQPCPRDDWEGWARLTREAGVPVAADESCRSPADALHIVGNGLAQVLNIKLVKSGVVGALDIAAIARAGGLALMIGGMVETRIGMGFAAHFAAGLGGFEWVDLDTALLLADDPVEDGPRVERAHYRLDPARAGHGARWR